MIFAQLINALLTNIELTFAEDICLFGSGIFKIKI